MTRVWVVVTRDIPLGVAANAVAHMAAGAGTQMAAVHDVPVPLDSVRVDRCAPDRVRAARAAGLQAGAVVVDFVRTMTGDTYVEQLDRTRAMPAADLEYYGVLLVGQGEVLDSLRVALGG